MRANYPSKSAHQWLLNRRDLLVSGSALILTGCLPVIAKPQSGSLIPIGDAHAHLFNGADLPVKGFYENVLAPNQLQGWPQFALAIIDSAMVTLKTFCKTADQERSELFAPFVEEQEPSPLQFAEEIKRRADPLMASPQSAFADPRSDLGASYRALAQMLDAERRRRGEQPLSSPEAPAIDRDMLAEIAQQGAEAAAPASAYGALLSKSPAEIWALICWAFQMTHSRRAHVHEYLKDMRSPAANPTLLINLLVDYDLWLHDTPTHGSEQPNQVQFWTAYMKSGTAPIQIETFAGFDPLKHAVEKKKYGSSTYFTDLKHWALGADPDRRVSGLKLYPPMGFSVWQNSGLPNPNPGRAAEIARKLWVDENRWALDELAPSLDDALNDLFDFATESDIPLLAHGRESNEAYTGAGEKTRPAYWLERALNLPPGPGRHPLRACFAHLYVKTHGPEKVREILDLNLKSKANIYFDVAFDDEILDPRQADQLLAWIEGICAKTKDKSAAADYFMFGTDWIMLAQIPHPERYVGAFDAAIMRSDFWRPKREKLMGGNLRNFLKL